MAFLTGYKTYILVGIFIAGVAAEKLLGLDIPGFDPGDDWLQQVMAALGIATVRAGVKTEIGKL